MQGICGKSQKMTVKSKFDIYLQLFFRDGQPRQLNLNLLIIRKPTADLKYLIAEGAAATSKCSTRFSSIFLSVPATRKLGRVNLYHPDFIINIHSKIKTHFAKFLLCILSITAQSSVYLSISKIVSGSES